MSAGRRRLWWQHIKARELLGLEDAKKEESKKEKEDKDGRFKSEGGKGRVSSS